MRNKEVGHLVHNKELHLENKEFVAEIKDVFDIFEVNELNGE